VVATLAAGARRGRHERPEVITVGDRSESSTRVRNEPVKAARRHPHPREHRHQPPTPMTPPSPSTATTSKHRRTPHSPLPTPSQRPVVLPSPPRHPARAPYLLRNDRRVGGGERRVARLAALAAAAPRGRHGAASPPPPRLPPAGNNASRRRPADGRVTAAASGPVAHADRSAAGGTRRTRPPLAGVGGRKRGRRPSGPSAASMTNPTRPSTEGNATDNGSRTRAGALPVPAHRHADGTRAAPVEARPTAAGAASDAHSFPTLPPPRLRCRPCKRRRRGRAR